MGRPKPSYSFYNKGDKVNSFINPYTFIPLDASANCKGDSTETQGIASASSEDDEKIVTGKLTCHLYLKTPLIIPDPDNAKPDSDNAKHRRYPFMKIGKDCIIPGSSIRGPVRSVYETVTNSCMSTMQKRQRITARSNKPFLPGLLFFENRQMKLYKAIRYRIRMDKQDLSEAKYPNRKSSIYTRKKLLQWGYGAHLSFVGETNTEKIKIRNQTITLDVHDAIRIIGSYDIASERIIKDDVEDGYLFVGEKIDSKHYESIFKPDGENTKVTSEKVQKAYENLKHALDVYENESVNRNLHSSHGGYDHIKFDDFEKGEIEGLPVWYKQDGTELYLSPACIGRFTYNSTMEDLVPAHKPCQNPAHTCKACELFGMIRRNKEDSSEDDSNGFGSHVRFGDAKLITPAKPEAVKEQMEYITLTELSSPKPSYLPFYLNSTNYPKGYDGDGATIKGRKFYWHHIPDMTIEQDKGERNATMEVLKTPAEFEFSVYFDDITKKQLHELEYVLCLGENLSEGDLCYKIGHGKPLGYGSAKICVVSEEIRSFEKGLYSINMQENVTISEKQVPELAQGWPTSLNTVLSLSFTNMHKSEAGKGVRYPFVINATGMNDEEIQEIDKNAIASHHWFSENYKFGQSKPKYYLPDTPKANEGTADISLAAIKLDDIKKDGISCLGPQKASSILEAGTVQKTELIKGQVISVELAWIKKDNVDQNKYFGGFNYHGKKGLIKNISSELEIGTPIKVRIEKLQTKNGEIFTFYVCRVEQ